MRSRRDWIYLAIVIAGVLFFSITALREYSDCREAGGSYVRGVFWFECVGTYRQKSDHDEAK